MQIEKVIYVHQIFIFTRVKKFYNLLKITNCCRFSLNKTPDLIRFFLADTPSGRT